MHYRRITPSPAVGKFVEFYWILEESAAGGVQRIVPDGRAGIILNFANPFESNTNGTWKSQPECFFVGQITGPLLLRPSGPAGMLGIQFRPQGAIHLLRLPMSQLTDSSIALEISRCRCFDSSGGCEIYRHWHKQSRQSMASSSHSLNGRTTPSQSLTPRWRSSAQAGLSASKMLPIASVGVRANCSGVSRMRLASRPSSSAACKDFRAFSGRWRAAPWIG
jgi:hypothetical protein